MTFIDFIYINLVTGELQVEPYDEYIHPDDWYQIGYVGENGKWYTDPIKEYEANQLVKERM